jgi:hypothetical protein
VEIQEVLPRKRCRDAGYVSARRDSASAPLATRPAGSAANLCRNLRAANQGKGSYLSGTDCPSIRNCGATVATTTRSRRSHHGQFISWIDACLIFVASKRWAPCRWNWSPAYSSCSIGRKLMKRWVARKRKSLSGCSRI